MNSLEKKKHIFETGENIQDYYLRINDPFSNGLIFDFFLNYYLGEKKLPFNDLIERLEEFGINEEKIKNLLNYTNNGFGNFLDLGESIFKVDDTNSKEFDHTSYHTFLTKSIEGEEYTKDEKRKRQFLYVGAEILKNLVLEVSGENEVSVENIKETFSTVFPEFDEEISEELENKIKNHVLLRTISDSSNRKPILKKVKIGQKKLMSIKELNYMFNNFLEHYPNDDFLGPIHTLKDTKGNVTYDLFYSILTMITLVPHNNIDMSSGRQTKRKVYATKNSSLVKADSTKLSFQEIDDELKSTLKSFLSIAKGTTTKKRKDIMNKVYITITKLFKLKQNLYLLKNISTSNKLIEIDNEIKNTIGKEYNKMITMAELAKEDGGYGIENTFDDQNLMSKIDSFGSEKIYHCINENPDFINSLEDFANNLDSKVNELNKKLKVLEEPTNIPLIYRENETGSPMEIDSIFIKNIIKSIRTNRIVHLLSTPGQGKSKKVEETFKQLGYNMKIIEPNSDPETIAASVVDDEQVTISNSKLSSQLSKITNMILSGEEYNILFFDEFTSIMSELSKMAQGEKFNKLFQTVLDPTRNKFNYKNVLNNGNYEQINLNNFHIVLASNPSLFLDEYIPDSVKSRVDEIDVDDIRWENRGVMTSNFLNEIHTIYEHSFEEINNKVLQTKLLKLNKLKGKIFPNYTKMLKDEKYKSPLTKLKESKSNFDMSSSKYENLLKDLKELYDKEVDEVKKELEEKSKLEGTQKTDKEFQKEVHSIVTSKSFKIKEHYEEILNAISFEIVLDSLEEKSEIYKSQRKELTKRKSGDELLNINKKYRNERTKLEFEKILNYLNIPKKDWKGHFENLPEMRHVNEYTDYIYNLVLEDKKTQYTKFFLDTDVDDNSTLSKAKIKSTIKEVINSENINLIDLLINNKFLSSVAKVDPTSYQTLLKHRESVIKHLKTLESNIPTNILPITRVNSEKLLRIVKFNDFSINKLQLTEVSFNGVKYKLPQSMPFLVDDGREFKENRAVKTFDALEIMGEITAKINKNIRENIQKKDEHGNFIDEFGADVESTTVTKIAYRDISEILKKLSSSLTNINEGTEVSQFFTKIAKILSRYSGTNYMKEVNEIIKEVISKNEMKSVNGSLYLEQSQERNTF